MTAALLLLCGLTMAAPTPDAGDPVWTTHEVDLSLAGEPAGQPVTDPEALRTRSRRLASGLRCPVCQGLSSADSQAESAVAIRTRVQKLVAAGYSDRQIRDYFTYTYGEWVLLEPPARGRHLMVWIAPALALGLGGVTVGSRMLRARRPEPAAAPAAAGTADEPDPYKRRILDELEG